MRNSIILLVALLLLGCNLTSKPDKPENLIPKDKMVEVLYDVYILNAAKGSSKIILEDNGIFPQDYVFEKFKIDSLQFAQSNAYYGFHVEEYESILSLLEQKIKKNKELYQAKIDEEIQEKKQKKDSIKKLSDTLKFNKKSKPIRKSDYNDTLKSSK